MCPGESRSGVEVAVVNALGSRGEMGLQSLADEVQAPYRWVFVIVKRLHERGEIEVRRDERRRLIISSGGKDK